MKIEDQNIEIAENFQDMGLKDEVLHGIYSYGFEDPSWIQKRAILPIKAGRNVLAQAQSGTGKTAAFTIGILEVMDESLKDIQALILVPTRELALQIEKVINSLARHTGFFAKGCIGGTKISEDLAAIRNGARILIGTPGRMLALIDPKAKHSMNFKNKRDSETSNTLSPEDQGSEIPSGSRGQGINISKLKMIVFDEADQMLSFGFQNQVSSIFRKTPSEAQVVLVSATFTQEVEKLAEQMLSNPVKLKVKKEELTLEGITQTYACIKPEEKKAFLTKMLGVLRAQLVIIYCSRVETCENICSALAEKNLPVKAMHGKLEQTERDNIMNEFRGGNVRYMVTTNLLARGIDIQSLGIVINYDLPDDKAIYLHRVGRTGRFGKKGFCVNIVTSDEDLKKLKEIEAFYDTKNDPITKEIIDKWSKSSDNL